MIDLAKLDSDQLQALRKQTDLELMRRDITFLATAKARVLPKGGPPDLAALYVLADGARGSDEWKAAFKVAAVKTLRELAKALGLPRGSFTVHFNPGGPAVSGDAILTHQRLFVCLTKSVLGDFGYLHDQRGGDPQPVTVWPALLMRCRSILGATS